MSRKKDKITKALKIKGYEVTDIEWESIGGSPIMSGPSGGWYIEYDSEMAGYFGTLLGYNIQEIMEQIEKLPVVEKN